MISLAPSPTGRRRTVVEVLLVEDNPGDARLLRELLRDVHDVPLDMAHVPTLAGALAYLESTRPDVILLDLSLPDTPSHETLRRVSGAVPDVPIIVLTGLDDTQLALRAMQQGAQDYLVKGTVDGPLLARAIRYAIERMRAAEVRRHLAQEQASRRQAQLAAERSRFLAQASDLLSSSRDMDQFLPSLAKAVVPVLADSCSTWLVEADGTVRCAARTHEHIERPYVEHVPLTPLVEGRTLVLPLVTGDRRHGMLQLERTREERFATDDVALALDVARRAALAVDNARLHRAREEVIAIVSHDLRNPLGVIGLQLELLKREPVAPEMLEQARGRIGRAVESMRQLISDLLDITRIDSGSLVVEPQRTPVDALLGECAELFTDMAVQRGIRLEVGALPDEHVLVEPSRIVQVLANLTSNALKFTPPGGEVRVAAERHDGDIRFTVVDTGAGIAEDQRAHVFDRFWQGGRHRREGAGLGLGIAKGIVHAHRGRIWLESPDAGGAAFVFTLPAA